MAGDLDHIHRLGLLRIHLKLEPQAPFLRPRFPGNMLRGALGYALAASDPGVYQEVFEPERTRSRGEAQVRDSVPPPYFFEWMLAAEQYLKKDEAFDIELVLIGSAARHAEVIVRSVAQAARHGLGPLRVAHRLSDAVLEPRNGRPRPLGELADPLPAAPLEKLELVATTPLRPEKAAPDPDRWTAGALVALAERRARMLAHFFGEVPVPPRDGAFDAAALSVRLDATRLERIDAERRSSKQARRHEMEGLLGPFTLGGDLEPLRPLLRAAVLLHVGRYAAFGYGRLVVASGA